jgi:hypothetical protein
MTNTDFLCEFRLKQLDSDLHTRYSNCVLVSFEMLNKLFATFPDFTDHTLLHSINVVNICNQLVGDNIDRMTADDLYVLLMGSLLHDVGMGVSDMDYELFLKQFDTGDFFERKPNAAKGDVVRTFHSEFSARFITKYGDFLDIPNDCYIHAIKQISRGHRKTDLFDAEEFPTVFELGEGRIVHLAYVSAILRLGDELDVANDRNPDLLYDMATLTNNISIFEFNKHKVIKGVTITDERILIEAETEQQKLYEGVINQVGTMRDTFDYCRRVILERSEFAFSQKSMDLEIRLISQEA